MLTEFSERRSEEFLMKKFSLEAKKIANYTNLSVFQVLKCFDAIPLIHFEQSKNAEDSNEDIVLNDENNVIKYIGGYIVKKLLQKAGVSSKEKDFLKKCVVKTDSLHQVSEPFFQILVLLEKMFRKNRSCTKINMSSAVECVNYNNTYHYLKRIAGDNLDVQVCSSSLQRVALYYYKIRGHRFAVKMLNEKLIANAKNGPKEKSLRKQLLSN